jgi:hypothetical protein
MTASVTTLAMTGMPLLTTPESSAALLTTPATTAESSAALVMTPATTVASVARADPAMVATADLAAMATATADSPEGAHGPGREVFARPWRASDAPDRPHARPTMGTWISSDGWSL